MEPANIGRICSFRCINTARSRMKRETRIECLIIPNVTKFVQQCGTEEVLDSKNLIASNSVLDYAV